MSAPPAADASGMEAELARLRARVAELEACVGAASAAPPSPPPPPAEAAPTPAAAAYPAVRCGLSNADVARYSRQLLVPAFGARGQEALRGLRVLIVGAGGLGCPAALALAGAGVGTLGVVDDDVVDASNLHRQTAHTEARVGSPKAGSLAAAVHALNSGVRVAAHVARFTAATGQALLDGYDAVLDCTDNPATRYMINDACALAGLPLVSGAALGTDGQLAVYGLQLGGGADTTGPAAGARPPRSPCYRCLHPVPPAFVSSCADAGVLGPVTAVVGSLQALEVLKLAPVLRAQAAAARRRRGAAPAPGDDTAAAAAASAAPLGEPLAGRLLVFDGADTRFRVVALRPASPSCAVCGDAPTIRSLADSAAWAAAHGLAPVEATTTGAATPAALPCECGPSGQPAAAPPPPPPVPHVSVAEFADVLQRRGDTSALPPSPPPILDVRSATQYGIARLAGSVNVPLARLQRDVAAGLAAAGIPLPPVPAGDAGAATAATAASISPAPAGGRVYVLCRRGVDSVTATRVRAVAAVAGGDGWADNRSH
jgi:adenylyltransferase and sulfurtransferase